jgi:predicted dehydrogenase
MMAEQKTRRSFLAAAAAGAGMTVAGQEAHAAGQTFQRKSPADARPIRVGVLTCENYSHISASWGLYMNPPLEDWKGGYWPRTTGLVMTHVWDPDPAAAKTFGERFDVEPVKRYDDMLGKVDAVIMSDLWATSLFPQMSRPYMEAGVPMIINRPFAFSMREARDMIDRAREYDCNVYCPSPYQSRPEVQRLRFNLEQQLAENATITGAFATQSTSEYHAHGVHGIYSLYAMLQPDVQAVSLQCPDWRRFRSANMTMRCAREGQDDYYATLLMGGQRSENGSGTHGVREVFTNQGRLIEHLDRFSNETYTWHRHHTFSTIFEFAEMIETGKMPESYDHILAKTRTYLSGFYSHLERDGDWVTCADLPEDWRAPEVPEADRVKGLQLD